MFRSSGADKPYHDGMTMAERPREEPEYGGPAQIQSAWELLAGGAPKAARALVDIAEHGSSDVARVAASNVILKMVGFGQNEVKVRVVPTQFDQSAPTTDGHVSPASIIEQRMQILRDSSPVYDPTADPGEVVDAEIVDG